MSDNASQNGSRFREQIAGLLKASKILYTRNKQTPCMSLFENGMIRCDFLLHGIGESGVYVFCSVQDSSGTADKKACYDVLQAIHCMDRPTVLIFSGDRMGPALAWAKTMVRGGFIGAFSLDEFGHFCRSIQQGELSVDAKTEQLTLGL